MAYILGDDCPGGRDGGSKLARLGPSQQRAGTAAAYKLPPRPTLTPSMFLQCLKDHQDPDLL